MRIVSFTIVTMLFIFSTTFKDVETRMTFAQLKKAVGNLRKPCAKKHGTSDELIDNANKGSFPPEPSLQCYQHCILDKMKVMKGDTLNLKGMLKQVDSTLPLEMVDRVKEVATTCAEQATSTESCELAWQFTKCYYEMDSSVYFFP